MKRLTFIDRNFSPWAFALGAFISIAIIGGCGGPETLAVSDDWPQEIASRKLYATEHAYIYASSPAAARRAEAAVQLAMDGYREQTGRDAGKGVLIVNDISDEPFIDDRRELLKMVVQFKRMMACSDSADEAAEMIAKKIDQLDELNEAEQIGIDIRLFFHVQPMSISSEQLADMGLPAAPGMWAAAAPTGELMWSFVENTMAVAMKKEDVTLAQKVIVKSMLPFLRARVVRKGRNISKVAVFAHLANQDQTLTGEARVKIVDEFKDRYGFE